jgi:hypothetical protein
MGDLCERLMEALEEIGPILLRFHELYGMVLSSSVLTYSDDYERIYNRQKHRRLAQTLSSIYIDFVVLRAHF